MKPPALGERRRSEVVGSQTTPEPCPHSRVPRMPWTLLSQPQLVRRQSAMCSLNCPVPRAACGAAPAPPGVREGRGTPASWLSAAGGSCDPSADTVLPEHSAARCHRRAHRPGLLWQPQCQGADPALSPGPAAVPAPWGRGGHSCPGESALRVCEENCGDIGAHGAQGTTEPSHLRHRAPQPAVPEPRPPLIYVTGVGRRGPG